MGVEEVLQVGWDRAEGVIPFRWVWLRRMLVLEPIECKLHGEKKMY